MKSREIGQRLFQLPEFIGATIVVFFASFRSEVDTIPMIRRALGEGKRVVLPKVKGKNLELFEVKDFDTDVSPGMWGIPEPHENIPVGLADVDLMVVPGLVFDERGNRLGYGAGFYDRMLAHYQGITIGLAFETQIVPQVPTTAHDFPVKKVVTEKKTYG